MRRVLTEPALGRWTAPGPGRYSGDGVSWRELPGTPWKPRHAASVFVHDGALWVVAGHNMEADVWKLVRRRPRAGAGRGD